VGQKLFSLVAVVCFSALIGCGKDDGDSDNKYPFPNYKTSNALGKELDRASLNCENSECDNNKKEFEAVGLVGMVIEGKSSDFSVRVGQCTGFLYGSNDIVALNSHCITDSMWEQRGDCSEYLGIKFPATPGHEAEIRMCEEIIYRSSLEGDSSVNIKQDYAFFRIKPVERTVLNLSAYPVKNQDEISVRKVNPVKGSISGTLDYAHCKAQTESMLNFQYVSEWSDTGLAVQKDIYGKTCKIMQGNSGSPVLNTRGEIVGFVQSYATDNYIKLLKLGFLEKDLKQKYKMDVKLEMPSSMPQHFHFTQSICVKNPKAIDSENLTCKNNLKKNSDDDFYSDFENAKNVDEYVANIKSTIVRSYPQFLTYDLVKKQDDYSYSVHPVCLLDAKRWDKANLQIENVGFLGKAKNVKTSSRAMFIKLLATYHFDNNFAFTKKTLSYSTENGYFEADVDGANLKLHRKFMSSANYYSENKEEIKNISWCP
jgi:hypothetical protein